MDLLKLCSDQVLQEINKKSVSSTSVPSGPPHRRFMLQSLHSYYAFGQSSKSEIHLLIGHCPYSYADLTDAPLFHIDHPGK